MNHLDEILDDLSLGHEETKAAVLAYIADYIDATPEQRNKLQILLGGDV